MQAPRSSIQFILASLLWLSVQAFAADTDGDGVDDVGGTVLYSTSFDTAGSWSYGSWTRTNTTPTNARTPSWYVYTNCFLLGCSNPFTMTFTFNVTHPSHISFWAKSNTASPTQLPFFIDNVSAGTFRFDRYGYLEAKATVSAGSHTFKWAVTPGSQGPFYIDDVSIITTPDNCPNTVNPDQIDSDRDGNGDACEVDDDNDGVLDGVDNCPIHSNASQLDTDVDEQGDACDPDDDNDGVLDGSDKFPLNPAASVDTDNDSFPNAWNASCDVICQNNAGLTLDNCPTTSNTSQLNADGDSQGDACDTDDDNDVVGDASDNCPLIVNTDQVDSDGDSTGNACDSDPYHVYKVTALSAFGNHTCALTNEGGVKCWGGNVLMPADVPGLTSGITAVSAGYAFSCALTTAGGVKCWGSSQYTQTDVAGLSSGVVSIAVGQNHACALLDAGNIKCWGDNTYGQLGDGTLTKSLMPVDVINIPESVASITAGGGDTCALTASQKVYCWGYGSYGKLGTGSTNNEITPRNITYSIPGNVISVVAGFAHTCVLTDTHGAKCWGYNGDGRVGDNTTTTRYSAVDVYGLTGNVAVVDPGIHTCAATNNGAAKCWGSDWYGQLGDGLTNTEQHAPVAVNGLSSGVTSVVTGEDFSCALLESGAVKCWGRNQWGQLGDNSTTNRLSPVYVVGLMGDSDDDNVVDAYDNCPLDANQDQADTDGDTLPDACTDTDDDNDGVADTADKFPLDATKSKFARHDTETDGDSDVLIRSASTSVWTSYGIQNNAVVDAAVMNVPTTSNAVYVAQLDANADGDADILTRNTTTGAWTLSVVEDGAVTSSVPLYLYANLNQQFVGAGDFNNDGTDDVMLRSASAGYYTVFLLNNHAVSSTVYYNAWISAQSVPQGIGDFDGDGMDDLLVRRTSDNLYFIFKTTNGATNTTYCACNLWANPDWTFQFAGDTNRDGIDDVVIRGTGPTADGKWWAFRMNNFSSVLTTNLNLFINKTAITVGAVGDYNSDGTIDVLTRINNSTTYVSPIVNGTITGNYWLYNFTTDQVIGR